MSTKMLLQEIEELKLKNYHLNDILGVVELENHKLANKNAQLNTTKSKLLLWLAMWGFFNCVVGWIVGFCLLVLNLNTPL